MNATAVWYFSACMLPLMRRFMVSSMIYVICKIVKLNMDIGTVVASHDAFVPFGSSERMFPLNE